MKSLPLFALVAALGIAAPAFAQDPAPAPATVIPIGTRVGVEPSGYDDGGRRDPFSALVQPKRAAAAPSALESLKPRSGLASLALADITVRGIVANGKVMLAILEGPNRQSFVARLQDKLLDGTVKSIDREGVVFVEVGDPGAPANEVRKTLRPAGEGVR